MLGIVLAHQLAAEWQWGIYLLMAVIGGSFYLQLVKIPFQWRWLNAGLLYLAFFILGYQLFYYHNDLLETNHFQQFIQKENRVYGTINSAVKYDDFIKFELDVEAIEVNRNWNAASGNLYVYAKPDALNSELKYGDMIRLDTRIKPIESPKNPYAFDFQNYLAYQNIFHQTFTRISSIEVVKKNQAQALIAAALQQRNRFLSILKKHLGNGEEFEVASALILGNKDFLSQKTKSAYSDTGAMHVLAVSGLHVGIIFAIVGLILRRFRSKNLVWKLGRILINLSAIWGFALLTGASASVIRASVMFSFFVIAKEFNKSRSIYNTIALAALCMLAYDPYLLYNVGFQLSFLAVIGIIHFQQRIYRLWIIDNKLGNWIWILVSVGIAAQLGTLPISLYYFHQFPSYFMLSGIIVVPAAGLILGLGIALFFFSAFPVMATTLAMIIGKILYWSVWLMNSLIFGLQNLPFAKIEGLWIGLLSVFLLYLLIYGVSISFKLKSKQWLFASTFALLFLSGIALYRSIVQYQQEGLVVYADQKISHGDAYYQKQLISLNDQKGNPSKINYITQNNRFRLGIKEQQQLPLKTGLLHLNGKIIFIIHDNQLPKGNPEQDIDLLWLSNSQKIDLENTVLDYQPKKVVIDGFLWEEKRRSWQKMLYELQVEHHFVMKDGAYSFTPD